MIRFIKKPRNEMLLKAMKRYSQGLFGETVFVILAA
jgi:hypothetical protein